ncbi:MAG: metal ABC transporter solute-binding protein, Zn/Mn family [Chitinispirillaceae bacterium]
MKKAVIVSTVLLSLALIIAFAVFSRTPSSSPKRSIAYTSILPQKDFVQRIAGERFEVHALVGKGQSPHSYTPTPDQMARLSEASVFFRIGVQFEKGFLPKIKNSMPKLEIVDLRRGITLRNMVEDHNHEHAHDQHDEHGYHHTDTHDNHTEKDPHVWLSPPLVKQMGVTIRETLSRMDTAGERTYEKNLIEFHRELDSLDSYIRRTLKPFEGTELFVFHPAFGYFADEYGLIQKPVETGGKEPSARELAQLIEQARTHRPEVIFVQPQYARKSAESLARQIGCAVVPINPLPENYFDQMRMMCRTIEKGLRDNE